MMEIEKEEIEGGKKIAIWLQHDSRFNDSLSRWRIKCSFAYFVCIGASLLFFTLIDFTNQLIYLLVNLRIEVSQKD